MIIQARYNPNPVAQALFAVVNSSHSESRPNRVELGLIDIQHVLESGLAISAGSGNEGLWNMVLVYVTHPQGPST